MNCKNITPGTLVEGSVSSTDISSDEINQLKAQMQDIMPFFSHIPVVISLSTNPNNLVCSK